jgi:hypothetical protein
VRLELDGAERRDVDEVFQVADWGAFEREIPGAEMGVLDPTHAPLIHSMTLLQSQPQELLFEDNRGIRYRRLASIKQEEVQHSDTVIVEIPPEIWSRPLRKDLFLPEIEEPSLAVMNLVALISGVPVTPVALAGSRHAVPVRFLRGQDDSLRISVEDVLPGEEERQRVVETLAGIVSRIAPAAGAESDVGGRLAALAKLQDKLADPVIAGTVGYLIDPESEVNLATYLADLEIEALLRRAGFKEGVALLVPVSRLKEAPPQAEAILVFVDDAVEGVAEARRNLEEASKRQLVQFAEEEERKNAKIVIGGRNTRITPDQILLQINAETGRLVSDQLLFYILDNPKRFPRGTRVLINNLRRADFKPDLQALELFL